MSVFSTSPSIASSSTATTNLYVSSYENQVTTLALTHDPTYKLQVTSTIDSACNPGWLVLDSAARELYCIGEGLGTNTEGALTTLQNSLDGRLVQTSQCVTPLGGCSGVLFRNAVGVLFLAIAHYQGSAISVWSLNHISDTDAMKYEPNTPILLQTINFVLSEPGPNPVRQERSHPHQVILDPTAKFIICPDLGADLIRIFSINQTNGKLAECPAFPVTPGAGPRHAIFVHSPGLQKANVLGRGTHAQCTPEEPIAVLYVVFELSNIVMSYGVTYRLDGGWPEFQEIGASSTFGHYPVPTGAAAAEISIFDSDLMIISNRNAPLAFPVDSDHILRGSTTTIDRICSDATPVASDSLSIFQLRPNGGLHFVKLHPAGGSFPRHFSANKAGNLVAVGLQRSGKVTILRRDAEKGQVLEAVAEIDGLGEVTCVVWDE